MDVFINLGADTLKILLGFTTFSWIAWGLTSVLLLVTGPILVQAMPRFVDPVSRKVVLDPLKVVIWMPLSTGAAFLITIGLVITIFGAVLAPLFILGLLLVGYLAVARIIGSKVLPATIQHTDFSPLLTTMVGILILRVVRLVPVVGALTHSLLIWIGFAAACLTAVEAARRWWRRRLPDEQQFRGELLVEWYPDGDPENHRANVGDGRPVLGNIRGDEKDSKNP